MCAAVQLTVHMIRAVAEFPAERSRDPSLLQHVRV